MKKSLSVLVALICGTIATVMASRYLNASNKSGQIPMSEVFVAISTIDIGEVITAEKIKLEQWPTDRVPGGATGDLTVVDGKYAKQRFYEGEPIMPIKLMDDNWSTVPKDYKVVAARASDSGIWNLIQPGDRVDVTAFFDENELIPNSTTKTVLHGIRVYALDGDTERRVGKDRPTRVSNIQLLIHEDSTAAWDLANQLGNVNLLVSSDADSDGLVDDGSDFVDWITGLQNRKNELLAAEREERDAAKKRRNNFQSQPPTNQAATKQKPRRTGFSMVKMSGGKLVEYYWEPGRKTPVIIGEVGSNESETVAPGAADQPVPVSDEIITTEESEEGLGHLNGPNSPFYRP